MKLSKVITILLTIMALSGITTLFSTLVHAESLTLPLDVNWESTSCTATLNGKKGSNSYAIVQGDSLTIHLTNRYSQSMSYFIEVSYASYQNSGGTLTPGQTVTKTLNNIIGYLNVGAQLLGNPGCNSSIGGGLNIPVGSAMLTNCSVVAGNKAYGWNISGSYTNVGVEGSLFQGSTFVQNYTGTGTINTNITASTSPSVFYFYGANSTSARLMAQITCPAAPPTSAAVSSGGSVNHSSTPAPTSTQPNNATTSTPSKAATSATATKNTTGTQPAPFPASPNGTVKQKLSKEALVLSSVGIASFIIALNSYRFRKTSPAKSRAKKSLKKVKR